jgi:hypothetical protein
MKNLNRFSEPYPENLRSFRVKSNNCTKIKLDLNTAYILADILTEWKKTICIMQKTESQLVNLLIEKLRNAEPELEF